MPPSPDRKPPRRIIDKKLKPFFLPWPGDALRRVPSYFDMVFIVLMGNSFGGEH